MKKRESEGKMHLMSDMITQACSPSTWEVETKGSGT